MMQPTPKTEFLPFSQIQEYCEKGYACGAIVFSPETENSHFHNCPPYISLFPPDGYDEVFFRVPDAVAYYGKIHAGYTMAGRERAKKIGRNELRDELKKMILSKD